MGSGTLIPKERIMPRPTDPIRHIDKIVFGADVQLTSPPLFSSAAFHNELVSRGLARPIPAAARRDFDEAQPSGAPN